jgi:Na+/H+ antiporter NhaC
MNCRTSAGWRSAHYNYIYSLVTGIARRCVTPVRSSRTVDGRVSRTCNRWSCDVTHRDRSAAGACVSTIIGSSPDTCMNCRTSSGRRSANHYYIHSLITGIAGRCCTPVWSSRAIDSRIGRACNRWSGYVTYSDGSAASACVATIIRSSPDTCMNCRTCAGWRCAYQLHPQSGHMHQMPLHYPRTE